MQFGGAQIPRLDDSFYQDVLKQLKQELDPGYKILIPSNLVA